MFYTTEKSSAFQIKSYCWKGFYYDEESGYYYANCRYYDPQVGLYIDADDPENILDNATVIGGLDKNAITLDNYLTVESNPFDIFTLDEMTADITYDALKNVTWWERNWGKVVSLLIQIAATIVSFATGNIVGGIMSLIGVIGSIADMILTEVCPAYAKVAGGLGTISNGYSAVSTGVSLFGFGPVGWIAGAICIAVGVSTMAIGVNEVISGKTGVNYLREWTGMSQEDYNTLYLALNITSSICVIVGGLIGKAASRSNRTCRASNCFIAGTLVMTAAGLKKIEDIQVGDMVLAYDEETGEQAFKPVKQLFRNTTEEWYHVQVNGEEIVCTGEHPFYVLNAEKGRNTVCYESAKADTAGKWVTAKELQISDKLLLSNGACAIIEEIKVEQLAVPETTYNFEVADFHTYYVSDSKILVHNDCSSDKKALVEIIKENGKSNPISMSDAETLVQWGKEYGLNVRIDMGHTTGSLVSRSPHLHTGFNSWHIPIIMK